VVVLSVKSKEWSCGGNASVAFKANTKLSSFLIDRTFHSVISTVAEKSLQFDCLRYFDFAQYDKQAYTTLLCHSEQREESLQSSANVSPSIQHSKFIISYNAKRRFATSISHFSFLISIFLRDYFSKIISQMRSTSSSDKSAYNGKVNTLSETSSATGVSFTSYLSA